MEINKKNKKKKHDFLSESCNSIYNDLYNYDVIKQIGKGSFSNVFLCKNEVQVLINEVDQHTEYAVMLSTCSGAWRYIIGDVIRFTNAAEHEMMIVGRTKQFLSLCGEHLSV